MPEWKNRFDIFKYLQVIGTVFILLFALVLLWHGNANSMQAMPAMVAQVYFDGEYRIADGQWQKIVEGNHISSTKGDVTLRGNFHMLAPDGTYVGMSFINTGIPANLSIRELFQIFPLLSCRRRGQ